MPTLNKVLTESDLSSARTPAIMDLTPYMNIIDDINKQGGVGGEITLANNERQRTEKRRLSLAAKQKGLKLTWRKSPPGQLRFVLSSPGQAAPGGRRRRVSA
ncbi:MAG TPA: hypothetical protein VHS28_02155 [Chloroflexota bacterium]|nr:hypothetical protein [Chloroflexota bacterium]